MITVSAWTRTDDPLRLPGHCSFCDDPPPDPDTGHREARDVLIVTSTIRSGGRPMVRVCVRCSTRLMRMLAMRGREVPASGVADLRATVKVDPGLPPGMRQGDAELVVTNIGDDDGGES